MNLEVKVCGLEMFFLIFSSFLYCLFQSLTVKLLFAWIIFLASLLFSDFILDFSLVCTEECSDLRNRLVDAGLLFVYISFTVI